ncbi:hypothetical protein [Alloalcanivorax xenomutans]|uniref:Uncharacterized protein n=1 Tax=Alloalcanivorax xenomutans TaxID=1094342 RepID=A0A9Q3W0Y0_9GAMM|nr:hypothetical protein [Alloalcanivorax xenomutans]MCE7507281.1 hypothetical protein [Alloalcanivorax xenomutans]
MRKFKAGLFFLVGLMSFCSEAVVASGDPPDGNVTYYEEISGVNILSISEQEKDGTFSIDFDSGMEGFDCDALSGTGLVTFNPESLRSIDMAYAFIVNALMNNRLSVMTIKVRVNEQWDSGAEEMASCEGEGMSFNPSL